MKRYARRVAIKLVALLVLTETPNPIRATNLGLVDGPRIDLGSLGRDLDLSIPDAFGICDISFLNFLCVNLPPPPTTVPGFVQPPSPAPTWSFDPAEKWLGDYQCRELVPALDRLQLLALASIFFATNNRLGRGPLWDKGWLQNCFPCTWDGVSCDTSEHIIGLSLASLGLTGKIHKFLGLLTDLYRVDLSDNALEGEIPTEIGYLKGLDVLLLHDNRLAGSVSPEICEVKPGILVVDCWGNRPDVVCNCCTFCGGFPTPIPTPFPSQQPSDKPSQVPTGLPEPTQIPEDFLFLEEVTLQPHLPSAQPTTSIEPTAHPTISMEPTRRTQPPAIPTPAPSFAVDPAELWLDEISGCGARSNFLEKLQLLSLASLYFSTQNSPSEGPLYEQNWLSNCNPCTWGRITCDGGNRLVELDLSSLGLKGRIHPFTGLLTDLVTLDLHDNYLTGEVPMGLHYLFNADEILLHDNWLWGPMPAEICDMDLEELSADCEGNNPKVICDTECCTICL